MDKLWFGKNDDGELKCERLVKYNGTKIEFGGLTFGNFELGKFGIEPKLIQAVSHALMLLDFSQYDLCTKIKGISDKETRDKYYKLMMEDKLRSQQILRAIAALSFDPQSKKLQDNVRDAFLSSQSRALDLEKSSSLEPQPTGDVSEKGLEIGRAAFKDRLEDLHRSHPELRNQTVQSGISEVPAFPSEKELGTLEEVHDIAAAIYKLNEEYKELVLNRKSILDFWESLVPIVTELTERQNRRLVGSSNQDALNNLLINLSSTLNDFNKAKDLGNNSETAVLERKTRLIFVDVLNKLEEVHTFIKGK